MPIELALWPEEIIALNEELATGLHRELEEKLSSIDSTENGWIERFGAIAEYCEVHLDGLYDSEQIRVICKILLPRLVELRKRPDEGNPEIIITH